MQSPAATSASSRLRPRPALRRDARTSRAASRRCPRTVEDDTPAKCRGSSSIDVTSESMYPDAGCFLAVATIDWANVATESARVTNSTEIVIAMICQ